MNTRMKLLALAALGVGVALGYLAAVAPLTAPVSAQPGAADAKEDRAADRAAIRDAMRKFAAAFQKGDAAAAAAFLTSGAELVPDDGPPVRGREAIRKAFAEHFAKKRKAKITLEPESLRFLSRDTALEEGHMKVTPEKGAPESNRYSVLYAREDGKWLLAAVREWESEQAQLRDLGWLIGKWSAKRKNAEVETVYEWFGNKAFIRGQITIRGKDRTFRGMQMIGIDPQTGDLRTWTFENDGGFGEGTCVREGKKWVFESATALSDGGVLTARNILVQVDADTFTWQPVNLAIDGEQVKDLAPVKVRRVKDRK